MDWPHQPRRRLPGAPNAPKMVATAGRRLSLFPSIPNPAISPRKTRMNANEIDGLPPIPPLSRRTCGEVAPTVNRFIFFASIAFFAV
jgi:hypothetical protein